MQCAVASSAGGGRADCGELHEWKRGRGPTAGARKIGGADGRSCGASAVDDSGELGSTVRRGNGEAAALGAGASGSRHCVFPEGTGDARFPSVSRLYGIAAGRGQVPERGARGQHGFRTVGVCVGYRRKACDANHDRSLGRPRNAVVLPEGWYLTASAVPATVNMLADGRVRLDFWNGRPDSADVLIKGKRRLMSGEKK